MDSLQRQSEMLAETARIVADTFNMIQEALGSPTRIVLPKSLEEETPEVEETDYTEVEEGTEEEAEEKDEDTCEYCDGEGWKLAGYQRGDRIDPKYERCSFCRGTGRK